MRRIITNYAFTGVAIKCWPDFLNLYGLGVCSTLAKLIEDGFIAGCEADVEGTITMFIQQQLTGQPPFLADLISTAESENTAIFWHCGVAPFSLVDPDSPITLARHFGQPLGLVAEFPLKPGIVTAARLSSKDNAYRMLIAKGEALKAPLVVKGTSCKIRFDIDVKKFLETIIYGGFEHHFLIIYQDIREELLDLCKLLKIEAVLLSD